jgi:hypothetical protein
MPIQAASDSSTVRYVLWELCPSPTCRLRLSILKETRLRLLVRGPLFLDHGIPELTTDANPNSVLPSIYIYIFRYQPHLQGSVLTNLLASSNLA